jgi:alkyl hydroperoxide reductase subunit AhpC
MEILMVKGNSVLLIFYPVDFCYIAPTELITLQV